MESSKRIKSMSEKQAIDASESLMFIRWYERRIKDNNFGCLSVKALCEIDIEKQNGTYQLLKDAFTAGFRSGFANGKESK